MIKFKSIRDLQKVFPTEQSCIKYLERRRWKGIITSPFDHTSKVYKCKKRKNWYKCKKTNKYFNVKTRTIFENTKISFQDWFWVLYVFANHKKGISSCQLSEDINVTQKTAWLMLQRLRHASNLSLLKKMLKDFVEIDEAFLGGSNTNRHWDKKAPKCQGRNWKDKIVIWAGVERGSGNMVAKISHDTKLSTLEQMVEASIEKGSTINSDEWYRNSDFLSKNYNHQIVNHGKGQYAKGKVSVNAVENRWSHFKPMISGTYRKISRKHAQKYVDEFVMRNNTRKYSKQDRFDLLLSSTIGKRLTYQQLIN